MVNLFSVSMFMEVRSEPTRQIHGAIVNETQALQHSTRRRESPATLLLENFWLCMEDDGVDI